MSDYYYKNGKPIEGEGMEPLMKWSNLKDYTDYSWVKKTKVGEVKISTVWLGLDHNFDGVGPPIIFETMIFGGDHDEDQWRYSNEK